MPAYSQTAANIHYKLLDELYRGVDGKTKLSSLIEQYKEYIMLYPNSAQEDEALFNLSDLYQLNKNRAAQFYTLIKLSVLHPRSPLSINAIEAIDSLIVYDNSLQLTDENERAIKEIIKMTPAESHRLAHIELLSFLQYANIKIFEKFIVDEIIQYKIIYGKTPDNLDAVNFWQASAYNQNGNSSAALLYFKKVVDVYKNSEFAPKALFRIGKIYSAQKDQKRAADYYIELINQYPEASETGDAQFELAKIYHYSFKDLNEALTNYKMLAQAFPENKNFNSALMNAGKISEELGDYQDALNSYMMIVENNNVTDETMAALKNILRIQLEILKDYSQAAQVYLLMAQMFPTDQNAPKHLLQAAKLYKEKVNNTQKSKEILQILKTKYKDSSEAGEAVKLMNQN